MVARMLRKVIGGALSGAVFIVGLALSGCSFDRKQDAARDVAGLLEAVRTDDRAAFEAHIYRPFLRDELREQLAELGRANGLDVGGASDFALDRRITPQAVKLALAGSGQALATPVTAAQVKPLILMRGDGTLCLASPALKSCLLQFRLIAHHWVLVAMPAQVAPVALPQPARP